MGTGKAEQRKTSRATITTGSKMVLDSSGSCVVRRLLLGGRLDPEKKNRAGIRCCRVPMAVSKR